MSEFGIALLFGAAVFLFVRSMYGMYRETQLYVDVMMDEEKPGLLLRIFLPFARMIGMWFSEMLSVQKKDNNDSFIATVKARLDKMIISAGTPFGFTAFHLMGLMTMSAVVSSVTIFGLLVISEMRVETIAVVTIVFTLVMFFYPFMWMRDKMLKRQFIIKRTLPYTLDLLTLSVEAGLDFTSALDQIVKKLGNVNPLCFELKQALREISMGKPRSQALRDVAVRVDVPEMQSVAGAIIQADELGASLGPVLRVLADQIRTKRFQRAEKLALEAPVKMLFPLVVFIFPTTFLIIFGPIIIKFFLQGF